MYKKNLKLNKFLIMFLAIAISGSVVRFAGNSLLGYKVFGEEIYSTGVAGSYANNVGFDETSYRVPGFDLKVFVKGGKFKLLYIDDETGAQFIFDLDNNDDTAKYSSIFFGCPAKDSSGKPHVLEHLLASPVFDTFLNKYKRLSSKEFNGITNEFGFYFLINKSIFDLDNLKDIFKELKKPTFLSDDEEIFKKEVYSKYYKNDTGRLYNEVLTERDSKEDFYNMQRLRKFDFGGKPEEVSKLSLKELESFYEQYVHPSNMLCYFCCGSSPTKIREVLELIKEKFLKHYKRRNIYLDYRLDVDENNKFVFKTLDGCPEMFKAMKADGKSYSHKYVANIWFNLNNLNVYEKDALFVKSAVLECIDSLKKEIEDLGYEASLIDTAEILKGRLNFKLFGNKKERFVKQGLEDSARKILKKFSEFLKSLENNSPKNEAFKINKLVGDEYFDSIKFQRTDKYRKMYDFYYLNYFAYVKHKNPFSDNVFQIKNGEILDDEDNFKTNFMNSIYNIFDKVSNNEIICIDVFERNDEQNKNAADKSIKDVKINIKNYKNDNVFRFVEYYLLHYVLNPNLDKLGLSYKSLTRAPYVGGFPQIETNEGSLQSINKFISKEFYEKLRSDIFDKYMFIEIVKKYCECLIRDLKVFENCLENFKHCKLTLEQFRNYGHGCSRQDTFLKLRKLFNNVEHNIFFNEKQDYLNYKNNEELFKKTFVDYFDNYLNHDKDYERFYSEIFKYIDYKIDILNKMISELGSRIRNVQNLKFDEVLETMKSCRFLQG